MECSISAVRSWSIVSHIACAIALDTTIFVTQFFQKLGVGVGNLNCANVMLKDRSKLLVKYFLGILLA